MDTIVLKFGGSSVADNLKLNVVAKKIIDFYNENNKIVVVVSAQGKTTDKLIKEAKELSNIPNDREMDVLLSTGEQISMSKLSILLNRLDYKSISLTGWQAGIYTNSLNQNAKIENIDTTRIITELNNDNIVIVAGFQGINEKSDITTLGRGGSDTTAVAIAAAINAKHCYIFSDVDGVYTTDPNKITIAKKLETLSYEEMLEIANEGAKVLHNRCIEVGQKYNIPIITKSTFNNKQGTTIQEKIEDTKVKSIVKNDDIIYVSMRYETYSPEIFNRLVDLLLKKQIGANYFQNYSNHYTNINFAIKSTVLDKFQNLLEDELKSFETTYTNISRVSIIGHGIMNDDSILEKIMKIVELNQLEILNLEINESKIAILFSKKLSNNILEQLHKTLI
ncbi:MAG: aspartate kinase [Clostridiaceae bacterium]|nr:aspartate kinase [Clostridiaceae bacterium]